jgi:hypothetical protein
MLAQIMAAANHGVGNGLTHDSFPARNLVCPLPDCAVTVSVGVRAIRTDTRTRTNARRFITCAPFFTSAREIIERSGKEGVTQLVRCAWAQTPLSVVYHDVEWGVPAHDDNVLFEFLILEGAQAGLSWETILRKRDAYRKAFVGFDPARVARFTPARVERLLENPGLVRNRLKISGAVRNARAFRTVQREYGQRSHGRLLQG